MNAVAKIDHLPERPSESAIDRIISAALTQDFDVDKMKELYALKRQYDADEARKSYVAAMAAFKSEPLRIFKDKHVSYKRKDGGETAYNHATIGNVVEIVTGALGKHQLAHRWDTVQENGKITVTCIITHSQGHSESTTLIASPDDSSGKNGIQAIASTITYLQRYTLLSATGLATMDQDDNDSRDQPEMTEPTTPTHERPEFADWRSKIDDCNTPEDFAAVWKEMKPPIRAALAHYVQQRKELKVGK